MSKNTISALEVCAAVMIGSVARGLFPDAPPLAIVPLLIVAWLVWNICRPFYNAKPFSAAQHAGFATCMVTIAATQMLLIYGLGTAMLATQLYSLILGLLGWALGYIVYTSYRSRTSA